MDRYVVYADWIRYGMPREPFDFAVRLEKKGWNLIPSSKIDIDIFKKKPCIILCITYIEIDISFLKRPNNILIYKIDDLFPYFKMSKKCVDSADFIVGPYTYLFNTIKDSIIQSKPNLWLPYSAVPEHYENINFNDRPKRKVFVSGKIANVYPLRQFISQNKQLSDKIETLDHPGYIQEKKGFKHDTVHGNYYAKLNEYVCCFCDCLVHRYTLNKIFEITSVGSLLLVEDGIVPQLNLMGFYDKVNCIVCNRSDIIEKVEWILSDVNANAVNLIRKKGMELTRHMHNTDKRIETFELFLSSIIVE
jgi:hypothetical protein